MWNTVLFDLDGTLSDSAPGITRCVQYALEKEFGIIRQPEELIEFVGPPLKEQFMLYTGCDEAMGERAVARYRERYRPVGIFENSLYQGIPELLRQLRAENFTIALSSSKPEEFCQQILETFDIAQYFDIVCGSDMEGRHTDKAEVIDDVLTRLGMEGRRDEVVLVGDRKYDIIGAKQRGIGSIGVSYGYGSREELETEWPDCIVDNVTELRNVLIGQARAGRKGTPSPNSPKARAARREADGGPIFKVWRIVYPLLIHVGIGNLAALSISFLYMLFVLLSSNNSFGEIRSDMFQTVLFTGIADAIVIPVAWLFFRADEKKRATRGFHERLLNRNTFGPREVLLIVVMVIGISSILNLLMAMLPIHDEAYNSVAEEMFAETGIVTQLVVIGVIAPIAEEIIFRGLVFRRLRDYVGFMWAAVASSLMFGIYHGNVTQAIFAFIMGMLFAAIYEHYGTMWATIAAHMANNTFAAIENTIFSRVEISDVAYLVFILIAGLAGISAMCRILTTDRRVNDV